MANPLFNRFGNQNNQQYYGQRNQGNNIISQLAMLKKNPGAILDILIQNGKINQQQYNDLQQYKNNPEMIGKYLINSGKANEINQAEQTANQQFGNNSNYRQW